MTIGEIFELNDISAGMIGDVGGKAANLGELTSAGFLLPPGFCVTTGVHRRPPTPTGGSRRPPGWTRSSAHRAGRSRRSGRNPLGRTAGHRMDDRRRRHPVAHPGPADHHAVPAPGPWRSAGFAELFLVQRRTGPVPAASWSARIRLGLVMEMGGPNSHGAVVAREYGIPAVVGVPLAADQLSTGDVGTVNGTAVTVTVDQRVLAASR